MSMTRPLGRNAVRFALLRISRASSFARAAAFADVRQVLDADQWCGAGLDDVPNEGAVRRSLLPSLLPAMAMSRRVEAFALRTLPYPR